MRNVLFVLVLGMVVWSSSSASAKDSKQRIVHHQIGERDLGTPMSEYDAWTKNMRYSGSGADSWTWTTMIDEATGDEYVIQSHDICDGGVWKQTSVEFRNGYQPAGKKPFIFESRTYKCVKP
jgi:hypothetical protein